MSISSPLLITCFCFVSFVHVTGMGSAALKRWERDLRSEQIAKKSIKQHSSALCCLCSQKWRSSSFTLLLELLIYF